MLDQLYFRDVDNEQAQVSLDEIYRAVTKPVAGITVKSTKNLNARQEKAGE